MRRRVRLWMCAPGLMAVCGCSTHLLFAETSHAGLKANFSATNPVPYEVDLGYRRGMLVAIPQKDGAPPTPGAGLTVGTPVAPAGVAGAQADRQATVVIPDDPKELMSLYSTFQANIGFNNPTYVRHFLATGKAATLLLSNHAELRKLERVTGQSEQAGSNTGESAPENTTEHANDSNQ